MIKEIIIPEGLQRPKTWRDIQEENGLNEVEQYVVSSLGTISNLRMSVDKVSTSYANVHNRRAAEKIRALCQMYILADYYNREYANGWVADWQDNNQTKHYPVWESVKGKILASLNLTVSNCYPVFASESILMECYKNNQQIFETALKP